MEQVTAIPAAKPARKRTATVKILSSEMDDTRQSVALREILEYKGHKLQLTVYSDAYKSQSYARVRIFHPTELKWNEVVSIPFGKMKTQEGIVYMPRAYGPNKNLEMLKHLFMEDRGVLIEKMKLIL